MFVWIFTVSKTSGKKSQNGHRPNFHCGCGKATVDFQKRVSGMSLIRSTHTIQFPESIQLSSGWRKVRLVQVLHYSMTFNKIGDHIHIIAFVSLIFSVLCDVNLDTHIGH
jgi:hypothetical protein